MGDIVNLDMVMECPECGGQHWLLYVDPKNKKAKEVVVFLDDVVMMECASCGFKIQCPTDD